VVNYYIPVVTYLDENWQSVADDFPLYTLMLYSIATLSGLSVQSTVAGTAVATFGFFALSVYYLGKKLFRLSAWESVFITIFAIVQIAVLRTTWDLHRDILALSLMFVIFGFTARKNSLLALAILAAICCLTVATDRMVGLVLSLSLIAGAIARRNRDLTILASISTALFLSLLVPSMVMPSEASSVGTPSSIAQTPALNYLVLFAVLNSIVAVPAIFGFNKSKNVLLATPFIVSGIGSLTWLAFANPDFIVPERWAILFGIFASVFSGYFIVDRLKRYRNRLISATAILSAFAVIGLAYAVLPYDKPFFLLAITKTYVENFMPITMQFNALDVDDNNELLMTIREINERTEPDAVIVGAKHWRGFMQLHLSDERIYRFSDDPQTLGLSHAQQGSDVYILEPDEDSSTFVFAKVEDSGRT
jgi:hypothetical protein